MATAFLPGAALPSAGSSRRPAACTRRPPRMDAEAPPESRVAPYYPVKGRFEAPTLSFLHAPECELVNKVGLVMEAVPLDLEAGAALLAAARPSYVKETGDFARLFSSSVEDASAEAAPERYFPMARRYEVPWIEIVPGADEGGSVTLAVGTVVSEGVEDDAAQDAADAAAAAREGAFWKAPAAPEAKGVVERNFGAVSRNKAPVIEIGALGFSIGMQEITGEPPAGVFADRYMVAPRIRIKAPAGEWDDSAFVEVSSEEVQLPILNAL